jgi:hypothetical protein
MRAQRPGPGQVSGSGPGMEISDIGRFLASVLPFWRRATCAFVRREAHLGVGYVKALRPQEDNVPWSGTRIVPILS